MFCTPARHDPRSHAIVQYRCIVTVLVMLCLCGVRWEPVCAQPPAAQRNDLDGLTVETLQQSIDKIQESREIDEATKASVLALYREALQDVLLAATWETKVREFDQVARSAAEEIAQAKASLAESPSTTHPEIPTDASVRELEKVLAEAEKTLETANRMLAAAEVEPRRRAIRRLEVERLLKEARGRAAGLERQDATLSADKPSGPLEVAQQIRLLAALQAAQQEVQAYVKELAAYGATTELLPLNLDLAVRETAKAKKVVKAIETRLTNARRLEAEAQIRQARQDTALAEPALQDLAAENEQLARERHEVIDKIKQNTETLGQVREALNGIEKEFEGVQAKLKSVGRTNAVALLLKTQRVALPSSYTYLEAIESQQQETLDAQMRIFKLAERRAELANKEERLGGVPDDGEDELLPGEQDERDRAEWELLQTQKEYVDLLAKEYYRYLSILVDLNTAEQELVTQIDSYRDYIDEHVLWIRSASPIWDVSNWHLGSVVQRILEADFWTGPAEALATDVRTHPLLWIAALSTLAILLYGRRRARRVIRTIAERAGASGMQHFLPTAHVALLTILLTVPALAVLAFLAWRISTTVGTTEHTRALASGLWTAALVYLPVEFFRQVCRPRGLAESHFGWPASAVSRLRLSFFRLIMLTFPLVVVATILGRLQDVKWQDTVGRTCFITGLCIVSCIMHYLLRRRSEVFRAFLAQQPEGWLPRAFLAGYLLAVVVPLLLCVIAALGYYFTAWHLASRWLQTVVLSLGLLVLGAFFLRWILVVRRRLAIERARQQRDETQDSESREPEAETETSPEPTETVVDIGSDLATINMQTRRFLYVVLGVAAVCGLWLIWADVFPALGVLKYVPIWETTVQAAQGVGSIGRTITLADLAWAVLILGLTFAAARNIPGLLEMSLLHHLPIDKGLRYAITTVCRYVLVGIGVVWACNYIGFTWSKIQWILAAMSVGLGFGLQEIFANFVSGMVILFERPIRIGDIITIGDATGKVTKIQMRATTIQDWDRKELVVPNKEFATGRILNWTLTDSVNRLVIEVGVSYNSNPDQVREILLKVAQEHPKVVDDPKPIAIFREFGDNALMFSLRVYLAIMKGRLEVIHEMHARVHQALREVGIEIAYPQLDLHVRSGLKS